MAGLAFGKAYRDRGAEVYFIGSARGFERELAPHHGFEISFISASAFGRQSLPGEIAALFNAVRGTIESRRLLRLDRPDIVISVGGFPSVGPSLAARWLGIPLVVHEANASPGLANWLTSRVASRVCEGLGGTGLRHATRTGNPVDREISAHDGLRDGPVRFLVAGGSEGSPFLNRAAPALLAAVRSRGVDLAVRHLAGSGDAQSIRAQYAHYGIPAYVSGFVERMDRVYAETDLAISCAGALTLAELAQAGIPTLLVPLATATNAHQCANARVFAGHAGCRWVSESGFDAEREAEWLASIARNHEAWANLSERLRSYGQDDAAQAVVNVCEELLASAERSR
jgi:UDP-N-acetylglucosamine--N-acetylmuramyl-(pentapeptide) pyrophosphoryl-undecaprenol N-acetylglucosamine transferase